MLEVNIFLSDDINTFLKYRSKYLTPCMIIMHLESFMGVIFHVGFKMRKAVGENLSIL